MKMATNVVFSMCLRPRHRISNRQASGPALGLENFYEWEEGWTKDEVVHLAQYSGSRRTASNWDCRIYVLRDLLDVQMPVNLVFMLMFCFVLLVLLSLSIGVSQLADKCKRLTQENAILEKRVRDLEKKLSGK